MHNIRVIMTSWKFKHLHIFHGTGYVINENLMKGHFPLCKDYKNPRAFSKEIFVSYC